MLRRLFAYTAAVIAAVGMAFSAVAPAFADGAVMGHLVSGANNGNNHFGGAKPEAFVLSDTKVGDQTVGADFIVNSDPAKSRVRFVVSYVDESHWAYVGYDVSNSWFIEYKAGDKSGYPALSGLPSIPKGQKATISVSHENNTVKVTVNGTTASVESADFVSVMKQEGKVGFGAATFNSDYTDVYFTNVKMGDKTVVDFSAWKPYKEVDGQTWEPKAEYATPEGRKWIHVTAGNNNGGGHAYGDASQKGPITLIGKDATVKAGDTVSLTFNPVNTNNFGIFYTYVDANNWFYIGYDSSSKWYWQCGNNSYGSMGGDLPAPVAGEPLELAITVQNEKVELSVNGKKQSASLQTVGDFVKNNSGKGHMAVMAKGAGAEFKFADAKVANTAETHDLMEGTWEFAANRTGQQQESVYVNLAPVKGTVTAKDGKPLEGAVVRVANLKATTDAKGAYTIEDVEAGEQTIVASYPGYQALSQKVTVKGGADANKNVVDFKLEPKAQVDLSKYQTIASDAMKVYVSDKFPQVVRYELTSGANKGKFFRAQETDVKTLKINGVEVAPTVKATIKGGTATYELTVAPTDKLKVNATLTVEVKVSGTELSWKITDIKKADGSAAIASIDISGMNLLMLDQVDGGTGFAGAKMSTNAAATGDRFYSFDGEFNPSTKDSFLYGFLSSKDLSAGIFSNSEKEKDERIALNNGTDTMGLSSSVWYYEQGDKGGQTYLANNADVTSCPTSELPWVKVAIADGDANGDGDIDWNDGAVATRKILNTPQGSEDIKNLVNYRIVMNFGSEVTNPYALTADNLKKVSLITDGLPQALLLKGYGNEGHDSANSEYADISEKEGGVSGFQDLIKVAHQYNTQVGIHVNAQEAYQESKSFNERMVKGQGNGWGWLDQSVAIDKLWDLGSNARWNRFVQLYDRINGTRFANKDFGKGEYVGDPVETGASAASMAELKADAAKRKNNMDFIYLDVWYQDAWETRRIAEQINSLGWRFSTEFPNEGEYDSTWSHWATEIQYGGTGTKGINSDIVRFLRNDQRDISPNNAGPTASHAKTAMNNPLLSGYTLEGFEGWGNEQDFNTYVKTTYLENLPTRFLQHYQVTDWTNYSGAEGDVSPVGNHEKQIKLKNEAGDEVVVTRHEQQRNDAVCEREITLKGVKVLDDDAYLLPWTDENGEEKLYHYNVDGDSTTWTLLDGWKGQNLVLYKLTDQGRVKVKDLPASDTFTFKAEAGVPYVIVKASSKTEAPTADTVDFGEGTGVTDPGFNAYENNEQLNAKVWSGDVTDASVRVETAGTGDQRLAINSPAKDVAVSTKLTGLTAGKTYVAELYIDNESDAKATIEVASGDAKAARSTGRSVAQNYTASDEKHTSDLQASHMTRIYVKFTAGADTATLTVKRAAGAGSTYVDNIRYVENEKFPVQDAKGNFSQDFENAVSGLYPFVIGPSSYGGDAVAHLSEKHAPYTQTGWHNKQLDDAIDGNWSLKYHDGRKGLLYQTTPQTLTFEPGKTYTVEFDYQTGELARYQMIVGHGEDDGDTEKIESYTVPTEFLPVTYVDGKQTTQHVKMEVTGADDGLTWIGLYSAGNSGNTAIGSGDFVLDNLKVTVKDGGTDSGDTEKPTVPGDVEIGEVGDTSAKLTWTPASDDTNVAGYEVFVNGKSVAKLGPDATSYTLEGLEPGTAYEVSVRAFDAAGNVSDVVNKKLTTTGDNGGDNGGTDNGNGDNNGNGGTGDNGNGGNGGTGDNSNGGSGANGDGGSNGGSNAGAQKPGNKPGGTLVQTGDDALLAIIPVVAIGAVLVVGGIVVAKRRRR